MASAAFIVGIIGNVISVLLCASPMGAFRDMVKKKSAEDYNAFPYISQLLCKSLWTFYGILDPNGLLIITVNSVGVASQSFYVLVYVIYAPKDKKVKALIFVALVNMCFPGAAIAAALFAFHGSGRRMFMGFLCAAVTITMYAAPLSVMRTVIKTKSVRFMPFYLSLFLLLNAGAWFTFGLIQRDFYVIVPNSIGLMSSAAQIIIYIIYKNKSSAVKAIDAVVEEGSVKRVEEGIRAKEFSNEHDNKNNNRSASPRNPSFSREFNLENLLRTVSLSVENESHSGLLLVLP